ncbi:hypothetical protein TNCV_3624371 [Trichonephila clavipes]|nr:hypothetical protein TNCV_3624371 [Trichonephila clavipes]
MTRGRIIGKLEEGRTVTIVAAEFGINKSVVSRCVVLSTKINSHARDINMHNLFIEHFKKQSYMQSAFLPPAFSQKPLKPVLLLSFPDQSIRNVGEPDSRKPFSPTSSEHSPQHLLPLEITFSDEGNVLFFEGPLKPLRRYHLKVPGNTTFLTVYDSLLARITYYNTINI